MKNYHDLYSERDVSLLADVFEKFRNNSFKSYGLCPSHYFRASGLKWNAMLKMTKIEPELVEPEQILTCVYSLRKVQEVGFLIFLIDTAKPTKNI